MKKTLIALLEAVEQRRNNIDEIKRDLFYCKSSISIDLLKKEIAKNEEEIKELNRKVTRILDLKQAQEEATTNKTDFKEYLDWCKTYDLKPCDYENLYIYKFKDDMGFWFDDFQSYLDQLNENQKTALLS